MQMMDRHGFNVVHLLYALLYKDRIGLQLGTRSLTAY